MSKSENVHLKKLNELISIYGGEAIAEVLDVSFRTIQNYRAKENPTTPTPNTARKIDEIYTKHVNGVDIKKSDSSEPDWKEFALEMKGLAAGWKDLASSQKIFIDQMERVSFNLNKLLLGVSAPLEEEASARPAAADELLQTGRIGSFQTSTQSVPEGSSNKKGR